MTDDAGRLAEIDRLGSQGGQYFAVCMAMDAFRIALGAPPRYFTKEEVILWLSIIEVRA